MKQYIVQTPMRRRDFDVAKILNEADMLVSLITDGYCYKGKLKNRDILMRICNKKIIEKLESFYCPSISSDKVKSSWQNWMINQAIIKSGRANSDLYSFIGKYILELSKNILDCNQANAIYNYDVTSLETFRFAKQRGMFLALEQCITHRKSQIEMYEMFRVKYGCKVTKQIDACKKNNDREEEEWSLADIILVPSYYVKRELILAGVNAAKIRLVPYGFSSENNNISQIIENRFNKKNTIFKILFVGNDMLRKGLMDLAIIALKLKKENIEFRIAGTVNREILERHGINKISNINFLGKLDKETLYKEYEQADLFILPSYLEGSAMVTNEALNFGLPAIVTEQSGSHIVSGVNGYICEAGDIELMISNILRLKNDVDLRYQISMSTISLMESISFNAYKNNLINALK